MSRGPDRRRRSGPASPLLDEEHLGVLRERPEVVRDDLLELVRDLADAVHGVDDRALDVLGGLEDVLGLRVVAVGGLQREDRLDELVDEPAELLLEAGDALAAL